MKIMKPGGWFKWAAWLVLLLISRLPATKAATVSRDELAQAGQWFAEHFEADHGAMPFSFEYGGVSSASLLGKWPRKESEKVLDENRTQHVFEFADPDTGLVVHCVAVQYGDFPTVEWTVYFQNTGKSDTPVLEDILGMDIAMNRPAASSEYVLHHNKGGSAYQDDYQLLETTLGPAVDFSLKSFGGRPSNENLCYMNLEIPGEAKTEVLAEMPYGWWKKTRVEQLPGYGMIMAVGWPGQWSARFVRDGDKGLKIEAGQETTHFILHPGEKVRTPLMALQLYKGATVRSQNIWRQWMRDHNFPKLGGKVPVSLLEACSSPEFVEMTKATAKDEMEFTDRYIEEGLKPDYWWMDAGWYKLYENRWEFTGTWEIDSNRFPQGFKPISENAHKKGVKLLVWFEPERVAEHTWLWENHPEWLLAPKDVPVRVGWMRDWKLLNLGNPEAFRWLIDHVDAMMKENGIDLYRQDFNVDPLFFWRGGDSENRQGMTENLYVQGYLAYFDELLRRHPDMVIDSCASGGRRNDLETMRRALPFVRSDYVFEPTGQQGHMYGISQWLPFHGTGMSPVAVDWDMYHFRSTMSPNIVMGWDMRNRDLNYGLLRTWTRQWRALAPYYAGDYYPLTDWSIAENAIIAWQFDRPDLGEGMVQAFRRPDCPVEKCSFPLSGIDTARQYEICNIDLNKPVIVSGQELAQEGIGVSFEGKPSAVVMTYRAITKVAK